MIVRDDVWSVIRKDFTDNEKKILRAAVTGESICPKGVVDIEKLSDELIKKLTGV